MKIKKWDKVLVKTWKDNWKQWKVLFILPKKNTLIIEWVNFRTKYKKKTQQGKWDMFVTEFPIHVSNVMVIWTDWKPTRVWYKKNEKWKKYRVAKVNCENLDKDFIKEIKT